MSILRENVKVKMVEATLIKGSRCPDKVSTGPSWLLKNMILFSRDEIPPVVGSKRFFGWYVP